MYTRLANIFSYEDMNKLFNANILLVGVGGVGSPIFECLVRSGIKHITIVDPDKYEMTNFNRQLHSDLNSLAKYKVEVLKSFTRDVSDEIDVIIYKDKIQKVRLNQKYDYIIDACDDIGAKLYLIKYALETETPIIVSLGIGNRTNPNLIKVTDLKDTYNDPLARKLRSSLKKEEIKGNIKVLFSKELPFKSPEISSYIPVTMAAGAVAADYVLKELIK